MTYKKLDKKYLQSERIYLREVRLEDVNDDYYNWLNDPEINSYLETRFIPQSKENILEYVRKMNGKSDEIFLAICRKSDGKHIGNIKIGPINWYHRFADVSIILGDKSSWGKGFASESIKLINEFAFKGIGLHKLRAGCYEDNIGSIKAFEKAGYKIEATFKDYLFFNGSYQNLVVLIATNKIKI
jgi:[ribosomal protein S5]-alanine N-acetyltransferase